MRDSGATLEIPSELQQSVGVQVSDATTLDMLLAGETGERLKETRSELLKAFDNLLTSIDFENLRLKQLSRRQQKYSILEISEQPQNRSQLQQKFLDELNAEIVRQVKLKSERRSIEIPMTVAVGAAEHPDRIVAATVYNASFENPEALKGIPIRFTMIHPGYGTMYYNRQCVFVRGIGADNKPIGALDWNDNYPAPPKNLHDVLTSYQAGSDDLLSFPKIISARGDDAIRTRLVW
jgi:hypothetical protein